MAKQGNSKHLLSVFTLFLPFCLLVFFLLSISSSHAGSGNSNLSVYSFGNGKVSVRLYSDYFCSACSSLEPKIEDALLAIVRKRIATVIFVDVPLHPPQSVLYARHFLFVLNEKKDLKHALKVRSLFFEAAAAKIHDKGLFEKFLAAKDIKYKEFDVKPVFKIFTDFMNQDNIRATPTCIIERNGKKETYKGAELIAGALNRLSAGSR